jgi:hypothetical protein
MRIFLVIWSIITGLSCGPRFYNFSATNTNAASILEGIRKEGIVVRVATQGRKLQYYKERMNTPGITQEQRKTYEELLMKYQKEDEAYLNVLKSGFTAKFMFSDVCFVPDTLFKRFLEGHEGNCLPLKTESVARKWPGERRAMLSAKNDRDDLVFVTTTGERLPQPLPYKKNAWFPAFKKIFQREKFINDQIAWYHKQFENQYITLQIQSKRQ